MRRHRFHRGVAKRTAHEEAIDGMKLAIRQLSLRLQQFTLGVDVDLQHARTAIFGPSGAGKTSLLETIAGLRKPDTAKISFNDQLFDDSGRNYALPVRLRKLGYVPQYDSLFPICQSSAISFTGATASQKITRLSSVTSSIFWTSDIYSIVTSVRFRVVRINVS
jgi:ABC-type molybdate transport system ATPase subunit